MNKRYFHLSLFYIMIFLLLNLTFAQESNELKVNGGLMYTSWVESDDKMPCILTIETPQISSQERYPLQVILLIDASQHMIGAPIQNAKITAKQILGALSDKDMFSIITYSAYARIIIPLQPMNSNNRRSAEGAINRIKYENNRNMSEGLKKAAEQFNRYKGQRSSGHYIMLLTNGDPDKGTTDPKQLLSSVEDLSKKYDVKMSTLGYDKDFNENFLIDCATKTGGQAYFVEEENISEIPKIFTDEMRRITNISTHSVTLEIIPPSGATITNIEGGKLVDGKIFISDIQAKITKPVMFELKGRPNKSRDLEVNIEYVDPVRLTSRKSRIYIDVPLGSGGHEYDKDFGPKLIEYTVHKNVAQTVEKLKEGNKNLRRDYGEKFRLTVKKLEKDNLIIRSDYLEEAIKNFTQLQRDIENAAILDPILTKRVKYSLLKLLYGK